MKVNYLDFCNAGGLGFNPHITEPLKFGSYVVASDGGIMIFGESEFSDCYWNAANEITAHLDGYLKKYNGFSFSDCLLITDVADKKKFQGSGNQSTVLCISFNGFYIQKIYWDLIKKLPGLIINKLDNGALIYKSDDYFGFIARVMTKEDQE